MPLAVRVLLGVVGLLASAVGWYVWVFVDDACASNVVARDASPDGALEAVTFVRACGATTGFSTHVSLIMRGDPLPDDRGDVFVADTDQGRAAAGPGGGPVVRITWTHRRALTLAHDRRARIFRSVPMLRGVSVRYVAFD